MSFPIKKIIAWSWEHAVSGHSSFLDPPVLACCICGRVSDNILNQVRFVNVWNKDLGRIQQVCEDHGNQFETLWNCITCEEVKLKRFPEWLREPRDKVYSCLVWLTIRLRFVSNLGCYPIRILKYGPRKAARAFDVIEEILS